MVVVVEEDEVEWWWWCRSSGGWLSQGRVFALEEQRSGRCGTTMRGEEGDKRIDAAIVVAPLASSLLPLIRLARQTGSDYSTTKRLCDEE